MRNFYHKFSLIVGVAVMVVLSGCGSATSTATPVPVATTAAATTAPTQGTTGSATMDHVRILVGGLSKQIYLPNTLAKQLGFFAEQNIDIELIDEKSGQSAEGEVLVGNVEAGSGAYSHVIELQPKGKNLVEVVQLQIAPGEAEVVASKKADQIKSMADLKGKNLGVTELGSGTHTISQFLLQKNGVAVDQVSFVPVGAGDTFIAAIKQGSIDAGMTTEPTVSRLVQSGDAQVLVDLRTPEGTRAALGADFPFISVFMTADYVNSHKDLVQRIVNVYVKTLKWMATHTPAEVADKMPADYYAGNKDLYVSALKGQYASFSPDGRMPATGAQFVLQFLQSINPEVKAATIDLSKTYTNEFVDNANK